MSELFINPITYDNLEDEFIEDEDSPLTDLDDLLDDETIRVTIRNTDTADPQDVSTENLLEEKSASECF